MIRAIRGSTQMADQLEAGRVLALGKSLMVVVRLRVIPNQSGIKSYCGKHRQDHTLANAAAPRLASTLASRPKFTTATRMAIAKISNMDQRPMNSIKRYMIIRCCVDCG